MSDLSSNLPDVLFVTHRVPYPPDKGDRIRTYHLLRYLAARSRVHLASFADEPVSDDTVEHLSKLTAKFATVPQGSLKWLGGLRSLALGSTISEGIYRDSRMAILQACDPDLAKQYAAEITAQTMVAPTTTTIATEVPTRELHDDIPKED